MTGPPGDLVVASADAEFPIHAVEENPFFSDAVLAAAREHLGDDGIRLVRIAASDERPHILAPIHAARLGRLVPAVAIWVHIHGPLGTPLLDADDPDAAAVALIAAMDGDAPGRRILEFPYLPLDGAVAGALLREADRQGRPVTILGRHQRAILRHRPAGSPDFRDTIAPKKRKELARQLRRLGDRGALTVEHVTTTEALPAALDDFLALEASGWKGRRGTALASRPREKAFAQAAIAGAAKHGTAAIHAIRLDGKAVAMLISFRAGDTAITWKIAYDEALGRYSPGVHVMLAASEWLLAQPGIRLIDSIAVADHPMVDHIWPDRLSVGTLVIGPKGGSAFYRIGIWLARQELRLRPLARRIVHTLRARLRRSASAAAPEG